MTLERFLVVIGFLFVMLGIAEVIRILNLILEAVR